MLCVSHKHIFIYCVELSFIFSDYMETVATEALTE